MLSFTVSILLIFLLLNILLNNKISANYTPPAKRQYVSTITISYQKDFPYKKYYHKKLISGCQKVYKNKTILRCDEYIILIRPTTLVKKWQRIQRRVGFLPITIPEFNIFNVTGKIISINPPKEYSKYFLPNMKSTSHMVTGKFIRHSDTVYPYIFTTKGKGRIIDKINATQNHLFYLKNKKMFTPVSKIQATDSLIDIEGKTIHLQHHINSKNKNKKIIKNIPETVYNLEISSNHTYFVGKQKILVHNTYSQERYFNYLDSMGLVIPTHDDKSIYLKFATEDKPKFLMPGDDDMYPVIRTSKGIRLQPHIHLRLRRMGFISAKKSTEISYRMADKMVLAIPINKPKYEVIVPYITNNRGESYVPKVILENAYQRALDQIEERKKLYNLLRLKIYQFVLAEQTSLLTERHETSSQEAFVAYFQNMDIEELQRFLEVKNALWSYYHPGR